jgi:alkylation response protein AidB-like acyl-CoA dehydrogenase
MKTIAEKAGGDYVLGGIKLSYSRPADDYFAVVFARTVSGPTCFLVDKGAPGFRVDYYGGGTGWLARVREPVKLVFDGCRVEAGNVLGEEGKAFHLGRRWLPQRRIVRGARCAGAARRLLEEAASQAQSTETFGQSIGRRSNIRAALADMASQVHAARLMVYEAAWRADSGKSIKREGVMLKLCTTQTLRRVADRAAHVFNGPPFIDGLPMEKLCRRALEVNIGELSLQRQSDIIAADVMEGIR